jgi:hypothetical protein
MSKIPELKSEYIWAVVMVVYIIIAVTPIGAPFTMSDITVEIYDLIEKLPPGSIIIQGGSGVFAFDLESSAAMIAAIKQMEKNDLRLVNVPLGVEAVQFEKFCVDSAKVDKRYGGSWEYGVDWVQLPYLPGLDAALVSFLNDVHGTVSTDVEGTPINELPIMNDLRSAKDIALWTCPHYDYPMIVRFVTAERGIPSINFAQASCYTDWSAYMMIYEDMVWMTCGFLGGAQYEQLMGYSGLGKAAIDGFAVVSIVYFAFIALGNITLLTRLREKDEEP